MKKNLPAKLSAESALSDAADFSVRHRTEILQLTAGTLVPIRLHSEWDLCPGVPPSGWMNGKTGKKKTVFQLTPELDLDTLMPGERKLGDEAVLYNRFYAPADGIGLIGIGTDWWFEAWSNGQRCASTWETGNSDMIFDAENHPFHIPVRQGGNLLAVRVRRGAASWRFDCSPLPFRRIPFPAVLQGPWLTDPDADGIGIRFFTMGKIAAGTEYRRTGTQEWKIAWEHAHGQIPRREFHAVHLSGLRGGSEYEYRIVMLDPSDCETMVHGRRIRKFFIPGDKKSGFSFFFTADLQYEPVKQRKLLRGLFKAADAGSCDFIVLGGDNGMTFSMRQMTEVYLAEIGALNRGSVPLVTVRGNHELRGDETELMPEYFAGPNGRTYGIFRYGDTAFLILDCLGDHPPRTSPHSMRDLDTVFFEQQKTYLEKVLRTEKWTSARRRIVLAHSAPYSHSDKKRTITANLKKMTDPWFAGKDPKYRIDLWLAGHIHRYRRSIPGSTEVAALQKPESSPAADGRNYVFPVLTVTGPNKFGYLEASAFRIDADRKKLVVRAFAPDGRCFEHVEIHADGTEKELAALPHYDHPADQD